MVYVDSKWVGDIVWGSAADHLRDLLQVDTKSGGGGGEGWEGRGRGGGEAASRRGSTLRHVTPSVYLSVHFVIFFPSFLSSLDPPLYSVQL